jgi:hypothetical protein
VEGTAWRATVADAVDAADAAAAAAAAAATKLPSPLEDRLVELVTKNAQRNGTDGGTAG